MLDNLLAEQKSKKWGRYLQSFFLIIASLTYIGLAIFFPPLAIPPLYIFLIAVGSMISTIISLNLNPLPPFKSMAKLIVKVFHPKEKTESKNIPNNDERQKNIQDSIKKENIEITGVLGEGGYGKVFLAKDQSKEEKNQIAVKIIEKKQNNKKSTEIKFLKSFNHPNIILFIRNFSIEKYECIVTEKLEYSLKKIINDGEKINFYTVKKIAEDIFTGLEYLHKIKISHCDIKPENLLMDKDGKVKIADFGISRKFSVPLKSSGTVRYMSPELYYRYLFGKTKIISSACDIYAAMLTLFELLGNAGYFKEHFPEKIIQEKVILSLIVSFRLIWTAEENKKTPELKKNIFSIFLKDKDVNFLTAQIFIENNLKEINLQKANFKHLNYPESSETEEYKELTINDQHTKDVLAEINIYMRPFEKLFLHKNLFKHAPVPNLEQSCGPLASFIRSGLSFFPEDRPSATNALKKLREIPEKEIAQNIL